MQSGQIDDQLIYCGFYHDSYHDEVRLIYVDFYSTCLTSCDEDSSIFCEIWIEIGFLYQNKPTPQCIINALQLCNIKAVTKDGQNFTVSCGEQLLPEAIDITINSVARGGIISRVADRDSSDEG